jgi:transposase
MGFIQGEGRTQGTLFPVTLNELIPQDHVCRVMDAFVDGLDMVGLGFERAEPGETGRPGYDPRDLLKLYLYGYLQQVRSCGVGERMSTQRGGDVAAESPCPRSQKHRRVPAHAQRSSDAGGSGVDSLCAFPAAGARRVGAVDGSKFRAVSSVGSVREREAVKRYLESLESADQDQELVVEPSKVAEALKKLQQHREPEAHFMRANSGAKVPAYNVQAAVDSEHALIVAHQVTTEATDNRCLLPMAEAAQAAVSGPGQVLHVVADAGYSNGEQAEACESRGILPHVPANRGVNNQGGGKLFDRSAFVYQREQDRFVCPAGQTLKRDQISRKDRSVYYAGRPEICGACPLKSRCTVGAQRMVSRHWNDEALQRMQQRATPEAMRLRRSTVEHPFATLKCHIFGHPRFLLRGRRGAQAEMSLAVIVYNLKRMMNVLGRPRFAAALAPA